MIGSIYELRDTYIVVTNYRFLYIVKEVFI